MKTTMRMSVLVLLATVTAVTLLSAQSADEILDRAENVLYPENYYGVMEMYTHNPGRRDTTMVYEIYYRSDAGSFMEVTDPARSRGTRFLQKGDDLWLFNPRSNSRRAIRLSPRESFQGSAFSNDDVSDSTYADDYNAAVLGRETLNHDELGPTETVKLELTAKRPTTTYGSIIMWVRQADYAPVEMEYYAKSGLLFKRMQLLEFADLAGRERPSLMRMESLEQDDFYSTVKITTLEDRKNIPDRYFSQSNLTR